MSHEKHHVEYVESGADEKPNGLYNGEDGGIEGYDQEYERKLIRKVDYRLLPILGALYAVSLIDRVNVSSLLSFLLVLRELADILHLDIQRSRGGHGPGPRSWDWRTVFYRSGRVLHPVLYVRGRISSDMRALLLLF
jgi:hypothetical protein